MEKWLKGSAVALLCASVVSYPAESSAQDIELGALVPQTGGLSNFYQATLNGADLATFDANAAGGVLAGGKVRIIRANTETNLEAALDGAVYLVDKGVVGLIGPLASGNTIGVAEEFSVAEGILLISPSSTSPAITDLPDEDLVFRTVPSDALQGVALAQIARNRLGYRNVAVAYVDNAYGAGLQEKFAEAFAEAGGTVGRPLAFDEGSPPTLPQLRRLSQGGAEALLLIAFADDGIVTLKRVIQRDLFTNFLFPDALASQDVIRGVGRRNAQALEGARGTLPQAARSPAQTKFLRKYRRQFGVPASPFADSGYDAAFLLMLAIEQAQSTDGAALAAALREVSNPPGARILPGEFAKAKRLLAQNQNINYIGAAGPLDFDEFGDVEGTYAEWTISNGRIRTLRVFAP